MKIYCTYCSKNKIEGEEMMPAIERYDSERIREIFKKSEEDEVGFMILSGKFGLLDPMDPIPWYNHLLQPAEAVDLSCQVQVQLRDLEISEITYFTESPEKIKKVRPYHETIARACSNANVELNLEEISK